MAAENDRTPLELREGVRSGILDSIKHDVERRGARTAWRLVVAGVVGVLGALGVTLLVSGHPFGHHPPWHIVVFSTVWAGLLVVSFAIALLGVRTPSLPLAHAASVGIVGLGLAGICGALCTDRHFLDWWATTRVGGPLTRAGGLALSAACFGLLTTLFVALVSSFLMLRGRASPVRSLLPAMTLLVLLLPGVALQSVGTSFGVFMSWIVGSAVGAYVGVAGGRRARTFLRKA